MTNAPSDLPDWTRAYLLTGVDSGGDPIPILLTDTGEMYTVLVGSDGATLRPVLVDANGQLIILAKGAEAGGTQHTLLTDASGQLVMVPRGQSGNYLDVDTNGYLTAVLKGIQGATLTTIAVDTDGRIEAFTMEAQDQWGNKLTIGNAELAARLGSPMAYDWRGQLVYYNDYGLGLGNTLLYVDGTGSTATIEPETSMRGGYSIKLVGGSDSTRQAYADTWIEHSPSTTLGIQCAFSYPADIEYATFSILRYIGGKQFQAGIRYDYDNAQLQYLNSSGTWVSLGNPYFLDGASHYHVLKLVADFSTEKYVRAMHGDTEEDLSAQSLRQVGTGYAASQRVRFLVQSHTGLNEYAYLDHIMLTVNEP